MYYDDIKKDIINKIDVSKFNRFIDEFEKGTIYLKLKYSCRENEPITKQKMNGFVYCIDKGHFDKSSLNQIVFYGRDVTVGSIKYANIVDGIMDFYHDYNIGNLIQYQVPNTEYSIVYDSIHNETLQLDHEYNLGKDEVPLFIPLYKLSELEQAYFLVGEDQYRKNKNIKYDVEIM